MTNAPYRLELLGGLGLKRPGELAGRATQRRQLALLALLASHDSPLSRDKLIGLLWPEFPSDRARHQLSDSIYVIRKELGEEAIVATGDTVQLDPSIVGSDLADFRSALDSETYEEALALYGGPFLDGFFPDGSEPFERWMAVEREATKRQAVAAAWALVDRAQSAGEIGEAIRWAHEALKIVPEDEQGVRRLMRLQDSRGDRAGALRTYEEFAARIEAELGVEPAPETRALVVEIRHREGTGPFRKPDRTPVGAGGAVSTGTEAEADDSLSVIPFTRPRGRDLIAAAALGAAAILATWLVAPKSEGDPPREVPATVAILPFDVRGEGLDVWQEGMIDVVSTNIAVFPELRAVPSRTVLAHWRDAEDEGRTRTSVLDVARRSGAHYAVTGSVVGTSKGLRLHGELYDLQTGVRIGQGTAEGPPDSIFALVDRVSVALMDPIVTTDGRWPRLASATTSSATALKAFLEGETLYRTGEYQPAIDAFKRAIDADSTFALAYYRLSIAYTWTSSGTETRDPARMAARYADRLPEREARLVRAWALTTHGRSGEWIEALREIVREHPDDSEAWYWLGEAYYHAGSELLVRPWSFVGAFERSLELDPTLVPAYEHLIDAAFQRAPDSARVHDVIVRRELVGGGESLEFRKAAFELAFGGPHTPRQIQELLRDFSSFELRGMATHELAHPRFLDLRETVLRAALQQPTPSWQPAIKIWLFWTLVGRGHLAEAIRLTGDPILESDRATMLYGARAYGYPIPEESLAQVLEQEPPPVDDATDARWIIGAPSIFEQGAFAAEQGEWVAHAAAKDELRALIPTIEPDNASDTLRLQGLIQGLEGYAAWRGGNRNRALALLREAQQRTLGGSNLVRATMNERNLIMRAWLGELLLEMGRPREALVYFESLGPGWSFGQDPMIYFRIGQVREELGDPKGAAEAYELAALAWQDPDRELRPLAERAQREAARLSALAVSSPVPGFWAP